MNVTQDMSVWGLVSHASLFVQLVMLGLLLASLLSWWYIFRKAFALRQAKADTEAFEKDFWSGGDLTELYRRSTAATGDQGPLARIFEAGMREFNKTRQQKPGDTHAMLEAARRAMRAGYQREMDGLESQLAFLASAGSVSPYIGLFGTVMGVIMAFDQLRGAGGAGGAPNDRVMGAIAEALIGGISCRRRHQRRAEIDARHVTGKARAAGDRPRRDAGPAAHVEHRLRRVDIDRVEIRPSAP
jgi:biopolymer transport protein TolQ